MHHDMRVMNGVGVENGGAVDVNNNLMHDKSSIFLFVFSPFMLEVINSKPRRHLGNSVPLDMITLSNYCHNGSFATIRP